MGRKSKAKSPQKQKRRDGYNIGGNVTDSEPSSKDNDSGHVRDIPSLEDSNDQQVKIPESIEQFDDDLPSVGSVVFYTLILPILCLVLYGKYQLSLLDVESDPVIKPTENVVQPTLQNQHQPSVKPSAPTAWEQQQQRQSNIPPTSNSVGIDEGSGNYTGYDESTKAFLKEWNSIVNNRLPRYTNDPRLASFQAYNVNDLKKKILDDPTNWKVYGQYISVLRNRDSTVSDGGSDKDEIILLCTRAVELMNREVDEGSAGQEILRSSICSLQYNIGFTHFMTDRFLDSADAYSKVLDFKFCSPVQEYNAMESRATSYIVLGMYDEAVKDAMYVLDHDDQWLFGSALSALVRIVGTKEGKKSIARGWEYIMEKVDDLLPKVQQRLSSSKDPDRQLRQMRDLYRTKYHYFEKMKNYKVAFEYLKKAQTFGLAPYANNNETKQKVAALRQVFTPALFNSLKQYGSRSRMPIFIVGSPRSGSTLLERILDAHPLIGGLSEDSVLNGRVAKIQNELSDAIKTNNLQDVVSTISINANEIERGMRERYNRMKADRFFDGDDKIEPLRLVDKQLTNMGNIGFIRLLFPKAVIFSVVREPMDNVFSNFKHDFKSPGLAKSTQTFESIADWYAGYREEMKLWDEVLPGGIYHIRYEEMVHDFERIARAVIAATGLAWDDAILDFHTKKQATNTYSTTQVKEKVYTGSIHSWKKYESELQPLKNALGKYATCDVTTILPGYSYSGPSW